MRIRIRPSYAILLTERIDGDRVSSWLRLARAERPSPLDAHNTSFLKAAIGRCESTCHPSRNSGSYIPTRLIDVKLGSTEDPCLVLTSEAVTAGATVKYAALSYCWGSKADAATQLKTETATIQSRKSGVPIQSMPHVMRDAVKTCRVLSIGYIWIDALCIIQDDDDDWARESAMMGSVYKGAFLTICALSSLSCHQGFLTRETHKVRVAFQSDADPAISGLYTLIDRGVCGFEGGILGNPLAQDLERSSWDQRAWVFQEKELSKRLVLFGNRMLHFRCGIRELSENGFGFNMNPAFPQSVSDVLEKASRHPQKERVLYDIFRTFATDYAPREITFAKDRLPAISGLAKPVSEGTGDQYLAGLWAKDLHLGLVWCIPEFPDSSLRECLERCKAASSETPSWSWASRRGFFDPSVGGFVLTDERHVRPEFTLIGASTVTKSANPFGAVSGGEITVRSRVMTLPSDLIAENGGRLIHRVWRAQSGASYAAHCHLDWDDAGSDCIPAGRLLLLLISSSCDGRGASESADLTASDDDSAKCSGDGNTGVAGGDGNGHEAAGEAEESDGEEGDEGYEWEEDDGEEEYPLWGLISEDGGDDCPSCTTESKRNAWGLVIHPADTPDSYYRVGIFTSRTGDAGGTRLFTEVGYQEVTLI